MTTETDRNESVCPGLDVSLNQYQWENRILVINADGPDSDNYQSQTDEFSAYEDGFKDRDLITFSLFEKECSQLDGKTINDGSASAIRDKVSPPENKFSVYLIGKDGGIKLIKDELLTVDELFSVIDRMPMRQREMRDGNR